MKLLLNLPKNRIKVGFALGVSDIFFQFLNRLLKKFKKINHRTLYVHQIGYQSITMIWHDWARDVSLTTMLAL